MSAIVLLADDEVMSTTPLLCMNVPPEFVKLPATVVVPVARDTVPVEIVRLLPTVTVGDVNDQLPPAPLKVRL